MNTIFQKLILVLIMLLAIPSEAYSLVSDSQRLNLHEKDNVIGKSFTLSSKILNEDRDIQIFLPESYHSSKQSYPVLFILDGQRLFTLGVSLSQSFRSTVKMSPEFIVVGINNKYPDRFSHFVKNDFLAFIEQELITTLDKNYRTSKERILFGWEYAGAYTIESLISKPTLFSGHIAASPFPIDESWYAKKSRIDQLAGKLNIDLKSHLYISVSEGEGSVITGTEKLNTLLVKAAPDSLRWKYRVIQGEEHISTAHASLFQGLKHYFYGYKVFHIEGLEQFQKAGGLSNFYAYNKNRAQRYGFSEENEPWSMFTIVRNAIRANDFESFELFMNEFKSSNMIEKIKLSRSNSIAKFYLQNKKANKAIGIYKTLAKLNPENAKIQHEIGRIYLMLNNKKITKIYYQKAVKLALLSKDNKLTEYQKDLEQLLQQY